MARDTLTSRVDRVEQKVDIVDTKVDALTARVDDFHLNGSGPAIRKLADASDQLVVLAKNVPTLIQLASERQARDTTFATLRRWSRWDRGTRTLFLTILTAALSTLVGIMAAHYFHIWTVIPK